MKNAMRNIAIISALTVALVGSSSPSGVASKRTTTKRNKVTTRRVVTTRVASITNASGGAASTTVDQNDPKQAVFAAYRKYIDTFIRVMANPTSAATEYPAITTGYALADAKKYASLYAQQGLYLQIDQGQYEILKLEYISASKSLVEIRTCERLTSTLRKKFDNSIVPDPLNPYVTERNYVFLPVRPWGWLIATNQYYEQEEGRSNCAGQS